MGLPAVLAAGEPPPKVGDLVIMGYFVTVQQGSATERVSSVSVPATPT